MASNLEHYIQTNYVLSLTYTGVQKDEAFARGFFYVNEQVMMELLTLFSGANVDYIPVKKTEDSLNQVTVKFGKPLTDLLMKFPEAGEVRFTIRKWSYGGKKGYSFHVVNMGSL